MKRRLFSAGVILVFALAASAGGSSKNGSSASSDAAKRLPGAKVFASAGCAGCHTLKDAGATGNVGPNLDQAKPPLDLIVDRVTNGKAPMPAFAGQLTPQQIQDVAAYVVQATKG
jgi:mono/diheme cytochrome c family protein